MRPFEKVYVCDFDGNILNAPTVYYFLEKQDDDTRKEVEVLAHEHDSDPDKYLDRNKYRFIENDPTATYQNTTDYYDDPRHRGPYGMFEDVSKALQAKQFAPSFEKFKKEVLIGAELFLILTARGPGMDTLKYNIRRISENILSQEEKEQQIENIKKKYRREKDANHIALRRYFDSQGYLPVNNIEVNKFLRLGNMSSADKKVQGMKRYIRYISELVQKYQSLDSSTSIKLGFSDDGFANIDAMLDFFASIYDNRYKRGYAERPYDFFDYRLYYTGNLSKEELVKNIEPIKDTYSDLQFIQEDKSHKNTNGILMPVTKLSIQIP